MRENKYDKLLFISIAVLIASALMLLVGGYNIYFKTPITSFETIKTSSNSYTSIKALNDSLIKAFANTLVVVKNESNPSDTIVNDKNIKVVEEKNCIGLNKIINRPFSKTVLLLTNPTKPILKVIHPLYFL